MSGRNYNNSVRRQNRSDRFGNSNYQENNSYDFKENVKKSGVTYSNISKGKMQGMIAVNAWRKTKNGLQVASCFPVDGVEHIAEKSGKTFVRYAVEVSNADMGTKQTYWCLMQKESKKITIQELGLVISPNGSGVTSSGKRVTGFFGKIFGKR